MIFCNAMMCISSLVFFYIYIIKEMKYITIYIINNINILFLHNLYNVAVLKMNTILHFIEVSPIRSLPVRGGRKCV